MSILIPGKMPTSWEDCAFSNEFAECTLDKDLNVCAFARMGNGCPLIELPPHGRLIDADKLGKSVKAQTEIIRKWGIDELTEIADLLEKGVLQEVENADTIIPAEEE